MSSVERGVALPSELRPLLAGADPSGTESALASAASAPDVGVLDLRPDRFEDRFEALAAIAYRVAYRLLGARPDAEGITQETLTRAYQQWRKVRGHAEPWVARVAANLALDAIRRGKRRPTVSVEVTRSDPQDHPIQHDSPVVDRLELVRGLNGLPRRQREVVVLRYLADLAEIDVARELGISVGSVKKHASRGLAAMRAQPDPFDQDGQGDN